MYIKICVHNKSLDIFDANICNINNLLSKHVHRDILKLTTLVKGKLIST